MWLLENHTPFAAERGFLQDKNGAMVWIVVIKGTFVLGPDGEFKAAAEPLPVELVPKYRGEPGQSSLLSEADLTLPKPATDVLLEGSAHAPSSKAAAQVDVRLSVGPIDKTVRVFGDRVWKEGLFGPTITPPEPFVIMPIVYERAFGGTEPKEKAADPLRVPGERRNPIGTAFCTKPEDAIGRNLPNVEDPKDLISSWKSRPKPVGFGPIARDWSPRAELAGTYDEAWSEQRCPLPPEDFQERFLQSAPEDQQAPNRLVGGERVELNNLTPGGGPQSFRVPKVGFAIQTQFKGEESVEQGAGVSIQTLTLEPDRKRLIIVWQAAMVCPPSKQRKLLRTTVKVLTPRGAERVANAR